jgi:phospholipase C
LFFQRLAKHHSKACVVRIQTKAPYAIVGVVTNDIGLNVCCTQAHAAVVGDNNNGWGCWEHQQGRGEYRNWLARYKLMQATVHVLCHNYYKYILFAQT